MLTGALRRDEEETYRDGVEAKIDNLERTLHNRMDSFEEKTTNSLGRIEKKQDYTNGKVAFLYKWHWLIFGFCLCLSIVVLPLFWALLQSGKL